ncbi:MAG: hypothetical protein II133_05015 [Lachnospiraceae bacterium]|nr:hypothetical protein [Lachnospiraceae bacterium]
MNNTIEYDTFKTRLMNTLDTEFGDGISISPRGIRGHNGATLDAYSISIPGRNLSPVFYPSYFYEKYRSGMSFAEIIENIKDSVRYSNGDVVDEDDIRRYEYAKSHIIPKLVNRDRNEDWIASVPHQSFLDVEMVFIYVIRSEGDEIVSFTVSEDMLREWRIDKDQLMQDSVTTAKRLFPLNIESIENVLGLSDSDFYQTFYVMSNNRRHYGASTMLYDHVLSDFADRIGCSFHIIPSSIHEVLLVPDSLCIPADELHDMLIDVNSSIVRDDEILSDRIYYYDRDTDTLSIRS